MTERIFRYLREQQPETPCLVIDLDVVENNFRRMRELLPAAHIFYAVKANPAAQILSRLSTLGSKFDTASRGEIELVQATGVAMDFHARLGGETLMARNIALAAEATSLLARRLNTEPGVTGPMAGCMGVVRLPLTGTATADRSADLRARLLAAGTDAPTHVQAGAIWLRLSAAAYNDIEDYERLAEIVARVLREAG